VYYVLASGCNVILDKLLSCVGVWLLMAGGVGMFTLVFRLLVSVQYVRYWVIIIRIRVI
jgi:hypothetical protein